jgi:hypothetical protein
MVGQVVPSRYVWRSPLVTLKLKGQGHREFKLPTYDWTWMLRTFNLLSAFQVTVMTLMEDNGYRVLMFRWSTRHSMPELVVDTTMPYPDHILKIFRNLDVQARA